jgi:transcriptional regulator with XRE-family HTH domain
MKVAENLKKLREILGLTQEEMAQLLGVSLRAYQAYEKGSMEPKVGKLEMLAKKYRVNLNWLITGEGEMFLTPSTEGLSPEFVEFFKQFPPETQRKFVEFFKDTLNFLSKSSSTSSSPNTTLLKSKP